MRGFFSFGMMLAIAASLSDVSQAGTIVFAQPRALTYYPDRATFDAVEPGLALQSFDAANLFGQPFVYQASPLDAATNDRVIAAGTIVPGIAIKTQHPGNVATALILYAGGPVGATSVGNNWFGDTLVLDFPAGVSAVGHGLFANTSAGPSFAGAMQVQFFSGAKQLGTRIYREPYGGFAFVGVSSATSRITRETISWLGDGDATTYVSDVAFGR